MSQQSPEGRTFQQAWQDLHQRLTKNLSYGTATQGQTTTLGDSTNVG